MDSSTYFSDLANEFEGEESLTPQEVTILRKNAFDNCDRIELGGIDTLMAIPSTSNTLVLPSVEEGNR